MSTSDPAAISPPDATATSDLATKYAPAAIEPAVAAQWSAARAFHAEPSDPGAPYAIVIPPPNVTAALHMGHALNNTLQDILTRWRRMAGDNAMWMPGTDHAGIATQSVVEKRLQQEGKRRTDFTRDEFIAIVQQWKDDYEGRITNQLKMMGCSCDWERQRFTMDPVCAASVREAFFQLFKDGLIYRGKRLVNWDPVSQTALADDEVEMEEVDGHFYYLKYPVVDAEGQGTPNSELPTPNSELSFITVATTRPETMLGDTAVAINPRDPRAAALRGKFVRLPIVNRIIPIIEDDYVVMPANLQATGSTPLPLREGQGEGRVAEESSAAAAAKIDPKALFATGFLKVTPAHDPNDYDIGRRHEKTLGPNWLINVMAPDASISKDHGWPAEEWQDAPSAGAPSRQGGAAPDTHASTTSHQHRPAGTVIPTVDPFAHTLLGKSREDARKLIVNWFREHGLFEDMKPYKHSVGHSYRSHVPIEPYLSDQWYVKVTDDRLRGAALRAMARDQFDERSEPGRAGPLRGEHAPARKDTDESQLRFYPQRYAKTFQQWHENIRDWCISRQLWWGHRIPVWSKHFENEREYWGEPGTEQDDLQDTLTVLSENDLGGAIAIAFVSDEDPTRMIPFTAPKIGGFTAFVCLPSDITISDHYERQPQELRRRLETAGFTQDPDVLDTWFSSGLWPISTLGWPDPAKFPAEFPGGDAALNKWNPSNTLCTAREIITLWVSRMVMFNIYFRGCLPFKDVFIHAMIQDGHGQKMSKSLGNGVDPLDIIHSHGSDAMRFTLAAMTTQTQDVRMTVEMVCPHCAQSFTPKFTKDKAGYTVAAPNQECPAPGCKKKLVSSYGVASGKAKPTDEAPAARNTSEKFDYGRNFANKFWNAVRFALGHVKATEADHWILPGVADQWILARLSKTIIATTKALESFEFKVYADTLYDFIWRDFCDWYIEAIKPTVATSGGQQRALVTVIDVILRLLHPAMPFITEKLWERLNTVAPKRTDLTMDGLFELKLPNTGELLVRSGWPTAGLHEGKAAEIEARFESTRQIVSAIREARSTYKVPPRNKVPAAIKAPNDKLERLRDDKDLIATMANVEIGAFGAQTERGEDAAAVTVGDVEIYLSGLIDKGAEKTRLEKRLAELTKSVAGLEGRLTNKAYTDKAPAKLVQETRDQLESAKKELEAVKAQLSAL